MQIILEKEHIAYLEKAIENAHEHQCQYLKIAQRISNYEEEQEHEMAFVEKSLRIVRTFASCVWRFVDRAWPNTFYMVYIGGDVSYEIGELEALHSHVKSIQPLSCTLTPHHTEILMKWKKPVPAYIIEEELDAYLKAKRKRLNVSANSM